jgi:iron complex transport system ATP-binding protein
VVASVHGLGVAAQYCSRLLLLDRGRVAAVGRPDEVLRGPVLNRVYGVPTVVSRNAATGSLSVSVVPRRVAGKGPRVHLIGGAGSAVNLTRELHRLGYRISGGIAHEYDSDEKLWKSLGCPCETVGAFSRIGDEDLERAAPLVREADVTILCAFPVGPGNLANLRLAGLARSLIVLESGIEDAPRSFIPPEGRALFEELCAKGRVMDHSSIIGEFEQDLGPRPGPSAPETDGVIHG